MVKRANINITKEDFKKLNGFFDGLKRYSQLETQKAIELFDNVTPVFRKLYLMDLVNSDLDDEAIIEKIYTEILY